MVGRGILGSPWLIGEIDSSIKGYKNFHKPTVIEKLKLINEHVDALIDEKGYHGLLLARKHISWSCKDFPQANNLRNKLVRAKTAEEIKYLILSAIINFEDIID